MKTILIILAVFSILATVIKFIKSDAWWIRMFDFPQAQLTFLAFISAAGVTAYTDLSQWYYVVLLITLLATLIYQVHIIIPYTFLFPVQVKQMAKEEYNPDNSISLVVANVYQYNKEYERCTTILKDQNADILIAVETDETWKDEIVKVMGDKYPYNCLIPLENTYGMLLFSRLELKETEIKYLVEDGIPSIHTIVKLPSGKDVRLFCVHPEPPSPTENIRSTERDAELIIVGKKAREIKDPVIVAGDLNDVAWSKSTKLFQRISGLLDPRIGRGFYNTFHAKYPLLRWPLDHIFHSDHFNIIELKRLKKTGSDHFPIYIRLNYHSNNQDEHETPVPDNDDIKESKETVDKAREENP